MMAHPENLKDLPVDEVVARVGVAQAIRVKHVASLLFTYRCSIACAHCLFSCSPRQPDRHVGLEEGLAFLRQLRATDRVIHIAGGEPMLYYEALLALCRAANAEGCAPHFIETNASWCKDDEIARRRTAELREAGLCGMLLSADPYHQRFVPPERYERAFRFAVETFGRQNVIGAEPNLAWLVDLRAIGHNPERLAEYARTHPPRLVGRAGEVLGRHFASRPLSDLANDALWHPATPEESCRAEFDPHEMWEIHIDPYGNIQTCCGIIVGNAHQTPLPEAMAQGFHTMNPLVRMVYERGPFAYLELAQTKGYQPPAEGFAQKCHLCWEVRKFLRRFYPETFGPGEIYEGA